MPFLAYLVVFIVTVFSVGLEWQALVEPAAPARHAVHAMSGPDAAPQQAPVAKENVNARPDNRKIVAPPPPVAAQSQQSVAQRKADNAPGADQAQSASQDNAVAQAQNAVPPQCDVGACASAYHTFRESDCTYQPLDGPRRLCTKGAAAADARAESAVARCHIRTCAEAYSSFNPSDCTYQPLDGPRRLCEK